MSAPRATKEFLTFSRKLALVVAYWLTCEVSTAV
jgi:hypothetical protein